MKILVVGETNWFGRMTENCAEALSGLGHDVEIFSSYESGRDIVARIWGRIENKIPVIREKRRYKYITGRNKLLIEKIKRNNYDLIFFLKGNNVFPETLTEIKKHINSPLAIWFFDDPFAEENKEQRMGNISKGLEYYDFKFCFDSHYVPLLDPAGEGNSYFLPLAFNPKDYKKICLEKPEQEEYGSNVAFIGSYFQEREKHLRKLIEYDLKLWGGWWPCLELQQYSVKKIISSQTTAKIYNASSINFNIHHSQSINGCNCRTFEIPGSGGFQIVDRKEDMVKLFEIGQEIICFQTTEELRDMVKYYLDHPQEREQIAQRGYERVNKEHTFKHRMQTMLDTINVV